MPDLVYPRILSVGDAAISVELSDELDRSVSAEVVSLVEDLHAHPPRGVQDATATLASVLVRYDPLVVNSGQVTAELTRRLSLVHLTQPEGRSVTLPVCYEGRAALDMGEVCRVTRLAPDEVAALHGSVEYFVHMIGFLPGFAYLGTLPEPLQLLRRRTPRLRVPARSVAVAGPMTAIYPLVSPGGWHVIGSTPVDLFTPEAKTPTVLQPGDSVRFERVDHAAYGELRAAWLAGEWHPNHPTSR